MHSSAPQRRLRGFLVTTFAISYGCWWGLAALSQNGVLAFGQPVFMTLYMLGGFGPTIAAYVAVFATRRDAPVREFHERLFRWRVGGVWYLVAFGLPVAIGLTSVLVAGLVEPSFWGRFALEPWQRIVPLFFIMIVGGGLEELGWRGVAQPELERRTSRAAAAALLGVIWAFWHLPLFYIPGVGQYETSFPIFAVGVVGGSLILAWLYGATRSILLCVIFHAALNATSAMGLVIPTDLTVPAVLDALLKLAIGAGLVMAPRRRLPAEGW